MWLHQVATFALNTMKIRLDSMANQCHKKAQGTQRVLGKQKWFTHTPCTVKTRLFEP